MAGSKAEIDTIEDSTLRGATFRKTLIKNCVLRYVEIHTSTISHSVLEHCQLFNCTIDNGSAEDTKIHECKFKGLKMKRCKVTISPLGLRRFPPEIRQMIVHYAIPCDLVMQKTPSILVALRDDQELYHEAIRAFYQQDWCCISSNNFSSMGSISVKAASNIQKLNIDAMVMPPLRPGMLPDIFEHCKSIRELRIVPFNGNRLWHWIRHCVQQFPTLEKIYVVVPTSHLTLPIPSSRNQSILSCLFSFEQHLGIRLVLARITTESWDHWLLKAEVGQKLEWKDDI